MEIFWDETASIPFWGKEEQLRKLADLANRCIKTVEESENPREMVLETWLVIDFAIRDFFVSGYGLYKYCQDEFDLRYELLPGFWKLLELLRKAVKYQSGLRQKPTTPDDYPPYIRSSFGFFKYLTDHHEDISKRLKEIEAEYFVKVHPELTEEIKQGMQISRLPKKDEVALLPNGWLEVVSSLGDDWYDRAKKLNKARNIAAHSYNQSAIAREFGKSGPRTVELIRVECLYLLKHLLGISLKADESSKS